MTSEKLRELSDEALEQVHATAGVSDMFLYVKSAEEIDRRRLEKASLDSIPFLTPF